MRDTLEMSLGEQGLRGERGLELCMKQVDWVKGKWQRWRDAKEYRQLHLTHSPSPRK